MKWETHQNLLKPHHHQDPRSLPPQCKSIRLAKKSKTTQGKGAIQVVEELLVKKLGDLSPLATQEEADQFEFLRNIWSVRSPRQKWMPSRC